MGIGRGASLLPEHTSGTDLDENAAPTPTLTVLVATAENATLLLGFATLRV